jgi:hypothetical protein
MVENGNMTDGTLIELNRRTSYNSSWYIWKIIKTDEFTYEIQNKHSRGMMSAFDSVTLPNTRIEICGKKPGEHLSNKWVLYETGKGIFEIQSYCNFRFLTEKSDKGTVTLSDESLGQCRYNRWIIRTAN